MASWYSKAYSAATSQLSKVFASEADGDTEDDTHVCRVLREYYTEHGRPFPAWLPPDPKAPPPAAIAAPPPTVGARFGNFNNGSNPGNMGGNPASSTGALSSLWGNNDAQQQQQQGVPASLRRGPPGRGLDFGEPEKAASAGVGGSAQDRFKKLYGGSRTTSPSNSGPFAPPSRGNGGGGGGDYEDRFAPGNYNMGGRQGGGGGAGGGLPSGARRGLPSGPKMR